MAEGECEATRYLERLVESAAPYPTRPLYGDLIGLCTQVDNLLCYAREQGKARITAMEAENKALRERGALVVQALNGPGANAQLLVTAVDGLRALLQGQGGADASGGDDGR